MTTNPMHGNGNGNDDMGKAMDNGAYDVPVLIVGGGPVGLCGALLLARYGVRSLLVERHPGTSIQPKARGINARTMELLRTWGLEDQVRVAGAPLVGNSLLLWTESLAGKELRRIQTAPGDDAVAAFLATISPTTGGGCTQNAFEPILLAAARQHPEADIRFNTELVALEQDATGARATIRDRVHGGETVVTARYVVAADGVHSPVRHLLGIPVNLLSAPNRILNIYFRANLTPFVAERKFIWCIVRNETVSGLMLTSDLPDHWLFNVPLGPDETADTYDAERTLAAIRAAVGVADVDVEILGVQEYTITAAVAARYREGKVFLVGDAAHVMPPAGAFGMNTGIQDMHNLAWKLAAVVSGWASADLLDSYEAERLPVGRETVTRAARRSDAMGLMGAGRPSPAAQPQRMPQGPGMPLEGENARDAITLGYAYASRAVSGGPLASDDPIPAEMPHGAHVGYRAPHLWITENGQRRSTLDLFEGSYTLLTGPDGAGWLAAGRETAAVLPVPLRCAGLAPAGDLTDDAGMWDATYGLPRDAAVLVRPDGFIAWIGPHAADADAIALRAALEETLGAAPAPVSSSSSRG